MNQYIEKIPDELFDLERPKQKPQMDRIRFTPTKVSAAFLNECQKLGYDTSTIINLALNCFAPRTNNSGYTWEGINGIYRK